MLTPFLAILHRRHGLTSRNSLSSSIDSSLDCPTRLRFRGGRRGSTSESTEPRRSLDDDVGSAVNEYDLSESLGSRGCPGTGGVESCKLPLGRGKYTGDEFFEYSML